MRSSIEFPVTPDEIEGCLLKLADVISAEGGIGDMRPLLLREAARLVADDVAEVSGMPPRSADLLGQLLPPALKPEEIEGSPAVREARASELVGWFVRHSRGKANSKWFTRHAYELATYVARLKSL